MATHTEHTKAAKAETKSAGTDAPEAAPQNVVDAPKTPKKYKAPSGGWQLALFNIANTIDIHANSFANLDDRLHWQGYAELVRSEVAEEDTSEPDQQSANTPTK